jgi:hypothetical protein
MSPIPFVQAWKNLDIKSKFIQTKACLSATSKRAKTGALHLKSQRVSTPAARRNRTCEFPRIRLGLRIIHHKPGILENFSLHLLDTRLDQLAMLIGSYGYFTRLTSSIH